MASPTYIKLSVNGSGPTGVAGTQLLDPGSTDVVSSCVFQIANLAASFSGIPRITELSAANQGASGPGVPLVTGTNAQYINLATGVVSPAGTAITANGVYAVFCPGCQVEMITSAGNADCTVTHLPGRVF